jgi:hypothetical protein
MPSFGMLRRLALVRMDVSEERSVSVIRVQESVTLAVNSNGYNLFSQPASVANGCSPILVTLKMDALGSSETSASTGSARRNIPEDGILQLLYCVTALLHSEEWWDWLYSSSFCLKTEGGIHITDTLPSN